MTQKTRPTKKNVHLFLQSIIPKPKSEDALKLLKLYEKITKERAVMWGDSIIGFGQYSIMSSKGVKGTWPLSAYFTKKECSDYSPGPGTPDIKTSLERFRPLYSFTLLPVYKKKSQINFAILETLIKMSHEAMKRKYL